MKNKIIAGATIAFISAILTSSGWFIQNSSEKKTSLKRTKLALIKEVSETVLKYRYLASFNVFLTIEKEIIKGQNGIDNKNDFIPYDRRIEIENSLKSKYKLEYEKMLESREFHPKLQANLVLVQTIYNDEIGNIARDLVCLFRVKKSVSRYINEIKEKQGISIHQFTEKEKNEVMHKYLDDSEKLINKLLNSMYENY